MVHVAGADISVARFLVSFLAREAEAFAVAAGALVHIGLAVGEVLEVLDRHAVVVGDPRGGAEVVAVVVVDVVRLFMMYFLQVFCIFTEFVQFDIYLLDIQSFGNAVDGSLEFFPKILFGFPKVFGFPKAIGVVFLQLTVVQLFAALSKEFIGGFLHTGHQRFAVRQAVVIACFFAGIHRIEVGAGA